MNRSRDSKAQAGWRHWPAALANWFGQLRGKGHRFSTGRGDEFPTAKDADWQQIAELEIESVAGKSRLPVNPDANFQLVKLRSRRGDVEVYRWTLQFDDGSIQELSINCLFDGAESRPILVAGRHLKEMIVEYEAPRTTRRGVLEILAKPYAAP